MPSRLKPETTWGEVALAQLTSRFADYTVLVDRFGADLDRGRVGRHIAGRRTANRDENALVDLVAVAENFTSARWMALNPSAASSEVLTWEKRRKAWKKHHSIDFADPAAFPEWAALLGFVEARNALHHGLGFLTERQLTKYRDETMNHLNDAAVRLLGHRVCVDRTTVESCLRVCEGFVVRLDTTAPQN